MDLTELNVKVDGIDGKLDVVVTDITEIKTALKGYNGNVGLCADHENLKEDFNKFRRTVLVIIGTLVGSGALGTSIYALIT